jgi:hypothetical protein
MHFWLNGMAISGLDSLSTWTAPTFDTLNLGWRNWQASSSDNSMWIDDVAFGTQRLGCL